MELYNTTDARKYLSLNGIPMSRTAFENHVKQGVIKPDLLVGRKRYFHLETLKRLKKEIRDEENYTLNEIEEMVTTKNGEAINKHTIRYNFCDVQKRQLKPIGRRSKSYTFSPATIIMVVKSEGWKLTESGTRELSQHGFHVKPE